MPDVHVSHLSKQFGDVSVLKDVSVEAAEKGKSYSDPTNWSSAAELQAMKMRWYFSR